MILWILQFLNHFSGAGRGKDEKVMMAGRMTMKMEGSAVPLLLLLLVICHTATAIGKKMYVVGGGDKP